VSIKISRTYRRLVHNLWLQLFSLHTKIVDLRSELSSLVDPDWDRCACSRVQARILYHDQALDLLQTVVQDPGDRTTDDGDASPVWRRDLEVQILIDQEAQVRQSSISTGQASERTLGLARMGGIEGAYRPFD
jgi:hypothetical protein